MERHDLDPVSLVFGIVFLALASTALFDNVDFTPISARWLWPGLLIVAGALVLVTSIRRSDADTNGDDGAGVGTLDDHDMI